MITLLLAAFGRNIKVEADYAVARSIAIFLANKYKTTVRGWMGSDPQFVINPGDQEDV